MKVLQLIDSLDTGGAEILAVNIANLLTEENIESYICVTRKEGLLKNRISKNVKYFFLNRKSTLDIKAIFKLKKYIKENKISIIHAHSTSSFIAFCIKFLMPKVKLIWHDHYGNSDFLGERKVFPLSFFSKYFNIIISVNKKLKNWAIENLKAPYNITLNNFAYFNNQEKLTKLKGEEGKRIVCIAGFRPQKDHLNLLRAFEIVNKNHQKWTLHLVGKVYKDKYSESIKNFISENNLSEVVFLYGVRSDIKHILSQANIGVLSSKSEGLPVALLEYGLAKLPVLITDVGDCSNVINIKNAIVKPNDSISFSKKMQKLIVDKEIRKEISSLLYKNILKEFSKESFTEKLVNVYKKLC